MDLPNVARVQLLVCSFVYFFIVFDARAFGDSSSIDQVDVHKETFKHSSFTTMKFVGCWPCTQEYLAESYFSHHNNLLDLDFEEYLVKKFSSNDLCKDDIDIVIALRRDKLKRDLNGDGSHRQLSSTLIFSADSGGMPWLDGQLCEAVIVERLPRGVFADPFELQHLVHRKVLHKVVVFGDSNLELPSALSNRSIVEIHMNIKHDPQLKRFAIIVELPLHARYPPLDESGYQKVEFSNPELFLCCKQKRFESNPGSQMITQLNVESASLAWHIPSGNSQHRQLVSSITFGSALLCSILIVFSAIYFTQTNEKKD